MLVFLFFFVGNISSSEGQTWQSFIWNLHKASRVHYLSHCLCISESFNKTWIVSWCVAYLYSNK